MSRIVPDGIAPLHGAQPWGGAAAVLPAVLREPLSHRARREALYSLISLPLAFLAAVVTLFLLLPGIITTGSILGLAIGLTLTVTCLRLARRFASLYRRLAGRLLGARIPAPAPYRRPAGSVIIRLDARLRDATAWRAVGYTFIKVPVAALQYFTVSVWICGLADLTYALWWPLFRNHPAGTALHAVPALTPTTGGGFAVSTWPGSLLVSLFGLGLLLAAPWLNRAVIAGDRWLIRSLLGTGTLSQRVRELEAARAQAVDDSVAQLRQVERDLHDGAQVRLAAMAMNLGMAKEKLGRDGPPDGPDLDRVRELVDAAHLGAKEGLVELRELVRGIHPPVLDSGLAEALSTLAAGSAIPVRVTADLTDRPSPAIENIAYFCVAELLANATKHSAANKIEVRAAIAGTGAGRVLRVEVSDDGRGGADPRRGSGLTGLRRRAGTVDGRLLVDSPPGGPTGITVELPMTA